MRIALFIAGLCVVTAAELVAEKNDRIRLYKHDGLVVDAVSGQLLHNARIAAFRDATGRSGDDCPAYQYSLNVDTRSTDTGKFTLRIPHELVNYVAVYCQDGYIARTRTINDNSKDKLPIAPKPVRLIPRKLDRRSMRAAIARLRSDATIATKRFAENNPDTYERSLRQLPPADQRALTAVYGEMPSTTQPRISERVRQELQRIASSLRMDLEYFAIADPVLFEETLENDKELREFVESAGMR